MNETDIDAIIRGGSSRRRWLIVSVVILAIAVAAVVTFLLTRPEETDVVLEPERVQATTGRLTTEVELSGSAVSERSADLGFEAAGVVATVAVDEGDRVREGDVLATLEDSDARRSVETSEVQLRLAQLRLDNLLAEPEESAFASANQAIATAKSQVKSADLELERLTEPPNAGDQASAEEAVANALGQLSSAEQALAELFEPPDIADLANAGEAVANALVQLSSAEEALAALTEPPSTADLASAEQAVASALGQLSSAEEELSALIEGASEAELSEARSALTQAQVELADATRLEEDLELALIELHEDFCERFSGLIFSDAVITSTCRDPLPMPESLIADMRESFEDDDVSAAYEEMGTELIDADIAFVVSAADKNSSHATLSTAEERLQELEDAVSEDDQYQAERAVEAAKASHLAAVARLEDLRELPSRNDVYQAEQAVEAAKANREAAEAILEELQAGAEEEELYQAEQALEAARASHEAAAARLRDLVAGDEDEIVPARSSLESALAGLVSAQAQFDELVSGPSDNEIEQQEQDVRLAELSVDEARAALDELTVVAPFDGVVEAVNVQPGDRIGSGFTAFTLSTSNRMLISLTVTEEDLLGLETGQDGVATFDAIEGFEYPVRVDSISRVPNAEQGVVTYDVEARILIGDESQDGAGGTARSGLRPGGRAGGGPPSGFQLPEGVDIQQLRQMMTALDLPEGVTLQQVGQALVTGGRLPEGVEFPEELEQILESIRSAAQERESAESEEESPAGEEAANSPAGPLPAPGMSARVTILTEIREESVLLPNSAVRQLDGQWFVSVPGPAGEEGEVSFSRVYVALGESDGQRVEIESGIEAGTVVLIGADGAGIAFSATQQQPLSNPGFGPNTGGFGPGGSGGRR